MDSPAIDAATAAAATVAIGFAALPPVKSVVR